MLPIPKTPISLSDRQLTAVMQAAAPLLPRDRGAFLEEVARELARLPDIGDGSLHRIIMTVQRKHFDPPLQIAGFSGVGKYGRGRRG
jgi:hypothetical protein